MERSNQIGPLVGITRNFFTTSHRLTAHRNKRLATLMKILAAVLIAAGIVTSMAAPAGAAEPESKNQITILYDAFGTDPSMTKDWGFSALVEVAGK